MTDQDATKHLLMSASRIGRTLTRIAFQIFEDTRGSGDLVILGINKRGALLATILSKKLSEIFKAEIKAFPVDLKNPDYAGSAAESAGEALAHTLPDIENKKVIIVDDVIYSGKTMFGTLQMLMSAGTPSEIKLAALVDRGHRRYPLNIEYLGMFCPTKLDEHVHCDFTGDGEPGAVWLHATSVAEEK